MQDIYPDTMSPERLNEILRGNFEDLKFPEAALSSVKSPLRKCKVCETKSSSSSGIGDDLDALEEGTEEDIVMSSGSVSSSRAMSIEEATEDEEGSALVQQKYNEIVILDCQNPNDYQRCHINRAINLSFPAILWRRILSGKVDLFERAKDLKAKVNDAKSLIFVIYDNTGANEEDSSGNAGSAGGGDNEISDLVSVVSKKLAQRGCSVATLVGGLQEFRTKFPEWVVTPDVKSTQAVCSSEEHALEPGMMLGSLASLRIDDPELKDCDSSIGLDLDDTFPVEIIPNLYLGNASISADLSILERHNIKHILNVTPDLPNVFENGSIRYLQIPISDHWTQSMLLHFPSAIQFIDEGRSKEEGVLVHCLAGISRSVTITMAYLMFKMSLSLNEAYDLVRSRKSNISPNFHFMGQLLDFERQLTTCQFLSPPALGSSPDSGIEFDRWNAH